MFDSRGHHAILDAPRWWRCEMPSQRGIPKVTWYQPECPGCLVGLAADRGPDHRMKATPQTVERLGLDGEVYTVTQLLAHMGLDYEKVMDELERRGHATRGNNDHDH